MAEPFFSLQLGDQSEVLAAAAAQTGRPKHLLEKDVWVVWTLSSLFGSPVGQNLVFKGGTSLSKAYGVIGRFSEDVDLTYDIRQLLGELTDNREDALPQTSSEEKRWSKRVRDELPAWIADKVVPVLEAALQRDSLPAQVRTENDKLLIDYEALEFGTGYVAPYVLLEFGARSTGKPAEVREVVCDASGIVDGVSFPSANPRVMVAERTFWEKATAIHVFCLQGKLRGHRFSRHWHDLSRLARAGYAKTAFADRGLAMAVARHKQMFFAEKTSGGKLVDYEGAVSGGLRLIPTNESLQSLREDYRRMVEDGLLLENAESFDELMEECKAIECEANTLNSPGPGLR